MKNKEEDLFEKGLKSIERKCNKLYLLEELKIRLNKNKFKGLQLLEDEEYLYECSDEYSIGCYDSDNKSIAIKSSLFNDDTIVHELIHALYDNDIVKRVKFGEEIVNYGVGIEEGLVNLITNSNNINRIEDVKIEKYYFQSYAIKQLNELYKNYSNKKYDNIVVHSLKEPETIVPLIPKIYFDAIARKFPNMNQKEIRELSLKCAGNLLNILDETAQLENMTTINTTIYYNCEKINAMLIGLQNKKVSTNIFFFSNILSDILKNYKQEKILGLINGEDLSFEILFNKLINKINYNVINCFDASSDEKKKLKR